MGAVQGMSVAGPRQGQGGEKKQNTLSRPVEPLGLQGQNPPHPAPYRILSSVIRICFLPLFLSMYLSQLFFITFFFLSLQVISTYI